MPDISQHTIQPHIIDLLLTKNWNEKTVSLAVKAVKGGHSRHRVAEEYGIPRSTLGDHIQGRESFLVPRVETLSI